MTVWLWVVYAIGLFLLMVIAAMRPVLPRRSRFESERLVKMGSASARQDQRRWRTVDSVIALQRVAITLFIALITVLSVIQLGWLFGLLAAVVIALEYPVMARLPLMMRLAGQWYRRIEPPLLRFADRFHTVLALLRGLPQTVEPPIMSSKEELCHNIEVMTEGITPQEKRLLIHGLSFGQRLVSEIMTPKSMIDSIMADELLGPITLDELHKTGHSRFPVIDGDIDHVIGMLYVQDLLTIDGKSKTHKASTAMEKKVFYIREDQSLQQALAAFLRTRHHLFVVINQYRETVGLLSLEDVMEALLGRKINDEFDTHEDLRKVAERNPRRNNSSKAAKTV